MKIVMVTDNTQVQGWINKGSSSNPYAMAWLRELFWVSAFFNITFKAARISSADNLLADALSRLNSDDSLVICEAHIHGFSHCCRAVRAAGGMGRGAGEMLVGQHHAIQEKPVAL